VGFEPTIAVLERAKTVRALNRTATAIGSFKHEVPLNSIHTVSSCLSGNTVRPYCTSSFTLKTPSLPHRVDGALVSYNSEDKQLLLPYTALIDCFNYHNSGHYASSCLLLLFFIYLLR
jgi:hypothetical protein